jgi:adenylylsulfate kinase
MEWDVAAGDCVWRNSAHVGERRSPLTYGKPDLRNGDFVIGLDDEDPAPGGAGGAGGAVVWLTGLPGSGKSTIAARLAAALAERGVPHELLDGDEIRAVFPQTGFSREERDAHVRRVGFIASKLEKHGVVAIVSLVSPYAASREAVRRMCRRFVEVHVATPLAECERRDPKGLYAKARRGEIVAFTGVSDPYEPPGRPEIAIDGGAASAEEAALLILNRLLNPAPVPREGRTGGAASP